MLCHNKYLAWLSTQPCWHPASPQKWSLTLTAAPLASSLSDTAASALSWASATIVSATARPGANTVARRNPDSGGAIVTPPLPQPTASSQLSLLTKDDAIVFCISLFPLISPYTTRLFAPSTNWHDSVTPCNLFSACPHIPVLSPACPVFHPYPCSSLNDNIFVMVAFVFLGPDACNCQDASPAHRLRGLLLRGNLGSLLRQLNSLTLCFLIKITLWLIRQKEGPSPSPWNPLSLPPPPPVQFPGRFDYNLWRTFLTAKLLKMCWQMRQPGQLVKPRGCRQPGRQGQSGRGRKVGGGKMNRRSRDMARRHCGQTEDQVCAYCKADKLSDEGQLSTCCCSTTRICQITGFKLRWFNSLHLAGCYKSTVENQRVWQQHNIIGISRPLSGALWELFSACTFLFGQGCTAGVILDCNRN